MVDASGSAAREDSGDGRRVSARGRLAALAAVAAAWLAACASPGAPPGGPPDRTAPVIVKVAPDSGALLVKAKSVTVRFSEVISERPRGGTDLSAIVVLSPSDGAARVQWQRDAITVRPRKEFRPNTAYSVTIMPGLSDLSGNATRRERTSVFSTGTNLPRGIVRGAVFDWTTLKPASGALLDARRGSDTTFKWIARSDSLGRYTIPLLPPGAYTLRAILDANANGRLEPRELWDSVTVSVEDSLRVDLYSFVHDTLGARIVGVDVKDSVTLRLTFDRPLALEPVLRSDQVEVLRADSSRVPIRSVVRAAIFDSLTRGHDAAAKDSAQRSDTSRAGRAARARADSLRMNAQRDSIERARLEARRVARDSIPRQVPPVPTRPMLASDVIALLEQPIVPGTYRIVTRAVVSASRVTRTSERSFTRAKPVEKKPTETTKPGAARPDSTRPPAVKPDATKPPVAKPAVPAPAPPIIKPPAR